MRGVLKRSLMKPFRLLSALAAPVFVICNGIRERLGQFLQGAPLKGEHIAGIDDFAVKDAGFAPASMVAT